MNTYDYENPDFGPLHSVLPSAMRDGWMWMNRSTIRGRTVEHYKHRITRSYLNLDHEGTAWQGRIAEHGCSPWCEETHEHRKDVFEHFTVPTSQAIEEALQ